MERFTLDYKSKCIFADQLAAFLRDQIKKGIILPGEKMPTIRAGGEIFGVSVVTVNNAYQILIKDGILESRKRLGIYVRNELLNMDLEERKKNDLIEEICNDICENYCRYSAPSSNPAADGTCGHFEDCPLNRLR